MTSDPFVFPTDAVETSRLRGEGTASVFSFEQEPLVGKSWAIGGRHVPNSVHILPSDRFSRSFRVFTGDLVVGYHQLIVAGHPRFWKPRFKDGDQGAQTEEPRDKPAV